MGEDHVWSFFRTRVRGMHEQRVNALTRILSIQCFLISSHYKAIFNIYPSREYNIPLVTRG